MNDSLAASIRCPLTAIEWCRLIVVKGFNARLRQ